LSTLLKKIHGSNHHFGKTPKRMPKTGKKQVVNMQELKTKLLDAIQEEDFEKAAILRDKIRDIEAQKNNET
ncbi:MAG: UvrB/UvrC motif-containing protein, partial [Candidatus Omnitrophica bacterium]|nr:UvrB/UvrC motif-containing protein [Candidatus Omnitrophota bacterium]